MCFSVFAGWLVCLFVCLFCACLCVKGNQCCKITSSRSIFFVVLPVYLLRFLVVFFLFVEIMF